jgi:hydroxymethylbilane synthase
MRRLRIGTRGSPLALAQAHETIQRLSVAFGWGADEARERLELVTIKTTGDRITDRPLAEAGGKGLFVKELEEALIDGRVDIAVHSMKDVPGILPDGLLIAAALPREDPRDALLGSRSIEDLKPNARVGTTSPRRAAQLLGIRPDVEIVLFRGNVQTRLDKLERGEVDATLLAVAGLNRLHLSPDISPLDPEGFIPAAGQGVVGLECRADDEVAQSFAAAISDEAASLALAAERACLAALDGSCRSAIAIHAVTAGSGLTLRAAVFALDGSAREDDVVQIPSRASLAAVQEVAGMTGAMLKARSARLLNGAVKPSNV